MSHRSHRSRDRDRDRDRSHSSSYSSSHKYDKYDKYENRSSRHEDRDRRKDDSYYRRDDSRDRCDRYYSSNSRKKSHRDRSRSRHRSRSHSKYHADHRHSSHKSRDYKELPELKCEKRNEMMDNKHLQNTETIDNNKHRSYESSSQRAENTYEVGHNANQSSYQSTDFDLSNETSQTDSTSAHATIDLIDDEDPELKAERERVQKETMERLQKHLQSEGKHYPPPRPQASHPIFANDGSFLEMFKSMQSIVQSRPIQVIRQPQIALATPSTSTVPRAPVPTIKRRGVKILKTGIVQKQRNIEETDDAQPTDSWNAYLKEVKRYKNVTCGDDNLTRPLVK